MCGAEKGLRAVTRCRIDEVVLNEMRDSFIYVDHYFWKNKCKHNPTPHAARGWLEEAETIVA